ncbi:signal peptidase I [Carnobacterium pleistocenium]|uniref:signal peptidase I n=1 Tax=Carnobacterium pleistocenium TaxID=181073 RepID=UPI000558C5A9|nr:signal peptidase I [Carnobacterium pleistocenium]
MSKINFSDGRNQPERSFEPRKSRHSSSSQKRKENKSLGSEILSTLLYCVVALIIFFLIRNFLFAPVSVDGESMVPTLEDQDRLILNKINNIERFDIVVFPAPDEPEKQYIKRIIGLPGDSIRYQDDTLYINEEPVEEDYLQSSIEEMAIGGNFTEDFSLASKTGVETVPEGKYFVMGDNRQNSKDSRIFGFVDAATVSGTASLRIWPLREIGSIDND